MTSLYGGVRVAKSDQKVETYGSVDELNSVLGVLIAYQRDKGCKLLLSKIQSDLFVMGAYLAGKKQNLKPLSKRVEKMEKFIDKLDSKLTPLKNFILPQGTPAAVFAHLTRSVCRRAEREVVKAQDKDFIDAKVLIYLNRLSDLLFMIARYTNKIEDKKEIVWNSKG